MASITKNNVHQSPHELPKDLRLMILGTYEILEKSLKWVETEPSAQSSIQK